MMNQQQAVRRAALLRECEEIQAQGFTDENRATFDSNLAEIEGLEGRGGGSAVPQIRRIVAVAGLGAAFAEDLIGRGATIESARAEVLDRLIQRQESSPTNSYHSAGFDGASDGRIRAMAEALAARFGGPKPSAEAREFIHMRVVDMAAACLGAAAPRAMSPAQIIKRALDIRGADHTTSDFPALLTETGNRLLRQGYSSYQGGVRRICKESTARDFRAKSRLMLGDAPQLLAVGEAGEFKHGSMVESKESYSLQTFGRIFSITRQALVNDDLGAFSEMITRFGRTCAEFVAAQLAAKLVANPALADGVALFHATHKNLGTASVISIASLSEALKMMRLQTGLDGVTVIDVTPKYLVVPAALEVVARQFVAQINATKASDVNPFTADLEPVVDPRLDASSSISWYLAADPNQVDTIEYSFLEDEPGPVIESRAGFEVDGMETKVRLDFGCGVQDFRGLFKNPGA